VTHARQWFASRWTLAEARFERLSLRTRLVAVLLALLLATCAVVAIVSAFALRRFLVDRLDEQLRAAGQRYSLSLEHPDDHDADNGQFESVIGQPAGTLGARAANGRVTAIGIVGGEAEIDDDDRAALAQLGPGGPRTIHLPHLGEYRVLATAGLDSDLLITGLPEHRVDETIGHLAVIEAIVFGVAVVVAGSVGALCVRLSLRPLLRVASTALRVSDLPLASGEVALSERVPNPGPGTEVGQVAEAFNHMLEHVESALSERQASEDRLRHFVADASHELRTPVAVIGSHAEYALHTAPGLPEQVQQALRRISAESGRMGHLVEDLLLLARLDAGRPLARDEVDLTRLVVDAVSDARVTATDHHWQLDLPAEPVTLLGDAHALHQALSNLLANASTHTPAATTVVVTVEPATEGPATEGPAAEGIVRLRVRDDGPGIAPDVRPHVFDRFVRGDNARSHTASNAGLGLSIVAAIVQAHGGSVDATSEPGHTEFTISLPTASNLLQ
jgi:two-component system, OmpR family, sensor kinase